MHQKSSRDDQNMRMYRKVYRYFTLLMGASTFSEDPRSELFCSLLRPSQKPSDSLRNFLTRQGDSSEFLTLKASHTYELGHMLRTNLLLAKLDVLSVFLYVGMPIP